MNLRFSEENGNEDRNQFGWSAFTAINEVFETIQRKMSVAKLAPAVFSAAADGDAEIRAVIKSGAHVLATTWSGS